MFFALAILSMLGYSIQGTLLVKYARSMDSFSLAAYRGITLALSMLPVFFFVSAEDFQTLSEVWHLIALSAFFGATALVLALITQKALPVGIQFTFSQFKVPLLLLWGFLFLGQTVSFGAMMAIAITLGGVVFLALQKHHLAHLDGKHRRGIFLALLGATAMSLSFLLMGIALKASHPLLISYFWEVGIALFALLFVTLLRREKGKRGLEPVSLRTFFTIGLVSSPTLLGTGAFFLAADLGSLGILTAIGSAGIIVGTLISHFLYHEKLSRWQWLGILVVICGVVALRLTGD